MIAEVVSSDLAMRRSADTFFDHLEKMRSEELVVDFSGVRSISRSFAHEYLLRKRTSRKRIIEQNVPADVSKMMAIIRNASPRKSLFSPDSVRMVEV